MRGVFFLRVLWLTVLLAFPQIVFDRKVTGSVGFPVCIAGVCALWIYIRRAHLVTSVLRSLAHEGFLCGAATVVIMSGDVRVVENLGVAIPVLFFCELFLRDNETM